MRWRWWVRLGKKPRGPRLERATIRQRVVAVNGTSMAATTSSICRSALSLSHSFSPVCSPGNIRSAQQRSALNQIWPSVWGKPARCSSILSAPERAHMRSDGVGLRKPSTQTKQRLIHTHIHTTKHAINTQSSARCPITLSLSLSLSISREATRTMQNKVDSGFKIVLPQWQWNRIR